MSAINPGSSSFQRLSTVPSNETQRSNTTHASTQAAEAQSAETSSATASEQTNQGTSAPQDSSQAQAHQESEFEPGALNFGNSYGAEPSFTPLQSESGASREEIQQSANDNLAQLRNKRIENRLNQLSEEQLRQIKDIRQP